MLHCIHSERELEQGFEVPWNTIPELHERVSHAVSLGAVWRTTRRPARRGVQIGQEQAPRLIIQRHVDVADRNNMHER